MPTWSILIATLASRQEQLKRLLSVLLPQAERTGNVEVIGLHNYAEQHIGEYRQVLLGSAKGDYVSYLDDDDLVDLNFVPLVLEAMARPVGPQQMGYYPAGYPDYIAFGHDMCVDGNLVAMPVFIGLQYGGWYDVWEDTPAQKRGFYRDVTHINPCKASIARQARFSTVPGVPDDRRYTETIRRIARTQVTIPQVLFHYLFSPMNSVQWMLPEQPRIPPLQVDSPVFRWHEGSSGW